MEFLKDIHRQLFENWNFSKENRLVFEGEAEVVKSPDVVEKPEEDQKPDEAVKQEISQIKGKIQTLDEAHKAMETKYNEDKNISSEEQKTIGYYNSERNVIKDKIKKLQEKKEPTLEAAKAVHEKVDSLIKIVSGHAETGSTWTKEEVTEAGEEKAEATEKKLTIDDVIKRLSKEELHAVIIDGLTMYRGERLFSGEKATEFMNGIKKLGQNFREGGIDEEKAIEGIVQLVQKIEPEGNHDFNSLIRDIFETVLKKLKENKGEIKIEESVAKEKYAQNQKLYYKVLGKKEKPAEEKAEGVEEKAEAPAEKLREGRDKAKAAIEKVIIEKFQGIPAIDIESGKIEELDMAALIKKPILQTMINNFLNNLPENRIKELEKNPNLPATKEDTKFLKDAFCKAIGIEEVSDKDPKEIVALQKFIGNKLPAQGGSLAEILSRTHKIVEQDGKMTINGNSIKDVAGLKPYLPANIQATFDAAIKENPEAKTLANLEQIAKRNVDSLASLQKMLDGIGESKEGGKKMGAIEGLMALLQLLPTIMEALKKGDFSIVNEMMADFNKGENPAKKLSESKKGYDKILKDKSPKLDTLLSIYEDPSTNNKVANDLFCEGKTEEEIKTDPLGKYRLMAKPAIQAQLAQKLGLSISKIESNEMGTKIEATTRGQKKVSINFYKNNEGKLVANILPYVQQKLEGGGTTWVEGTESKDIEDANWEKVQKELGVAVAKKPDEGGGKGEDKPPEGQQTLAQMEAIKNESKNIQEEIINKMAKGGVNIEDLSFDVSYNKEKDSFAITVLKGKDELAEGEYKRDEKGGVTEADLNLISSEAIKKHEELTTLADASQDDVADSEKPKLNAEQMPKDLSEYAEGGEIGLEEGKLPQTSPKALKAMQKKVADQKKKEELMKNAVAQVALDLDKGETEDK